MPDNEIGGLGWTGWRWTSLPISTLGGLHGSLLIVGPLGVMISLALGALPLGIVLVLAYTSYLVLCARHRRTPKQQAQALFVTYISNCQWRAR